MKTFTEEQIEKFKKGYAWKYTGALTRVSMIKEIEELISNTLQEVLKCAPEERTDPGDFGGQDDKEIRAQWWGHETCRQAFIDNITSRFNLK